MLTEFFISKPANGFYKQFISIFTALNQIPVSGYSQMIYDLI